MTVGWAAEFITLLCLCGLSASSDVVAECSLTQAERALEHGQCPRTSLVSAAQNAKPFPAFSCPESARPCRSQPGCPRGHTTAIAAVTADEYESEASISPCEFAFRARFSRLEAGVSLSFRCAVLRPPKTALLKPRLSSQREALGSGSW